MSAPTSATLAWHDMHLCVAPTAAHALHGAYISATYIYVCSVTCTLDGAWCLPSIHPSTHKKHMVVMCSCVGGGKEGGVTAIPCHNVRELHACIIYLILHSTVQFRGIQAPGNVSSMIVVAKASWPALLCPPLKLPHLMDVWLLNNLQRAPSVLHCAASSCHGHRLRDIASELFISHWAAHMRGWGWTHMLISCI